MKNCSKIHPLLSLEAEGALSTADHRKVTAHLKDCVEARQALASYRRLKETLRILPPPAEPKNLHESIMTRLSQEGLSAPKRNWGLKPLWSLAAAAATTVFFFTQNPDWREVMRKSPPPAPVIQSQMDMKKTEAPAPSFAPQAPAPARDEAAAPKAFRAEAMMAKRSFAKEETMANESAANSGGTLTEDKLSLSLTPTSMSSVSAEAPRPMSVSPQAQVIPDNMAAASNNLDALKYSAKDQEAPAPSSWSGDQDPLYSAPNQQVITDADSFGKIWGALEPNQPIPTVDFDRQAVVFIETGEEPTLGYEAKILKVESKPGQLLVYYSVEMAPDTVAAQAQSHPWVLQVITKPTVPVFFQQEP